MERVQDSALIPVNVERKVTLAGKHLNVFQVTAVILAVIQQVSLSRGHFCELFMNKHTGRHAGL